MGLLMKARLFPILLTLFLLGAVAGLTSVNYRFAQQNPGGSDFLPRWVGTRDYLIRGRDPYSPETTQDIQMLFYGRLAGPGEDQALFVYPLYSLLIFAPYALIGDYVLARAVWMTTLEIALLAIAFLSLRLTGWRLQRLSLVGFILFAVLWYHAVRPVINGNAVILCGLSIMVGLLLIRSGRDLSAAIFFALSTIKPQTVVVFILFIVWWASTNKRWRLVGGFVGALAILIVGAMLLIPDWLIQNVRQILNYPAYTGPGTPSAVFSVWWPASGWLLGLALAMGLGLVVIREWWVGRRSTFPHMIWLASLALVSTPLIGIPMDPTNYIVLFLPLVIVLSGLEMRWGRGGRRAAFVLLLLLFVGIWVLFLSTIEFGEQPVQNPILFFPMPLVLIAGLYVVRKQFTV